MTWYFMVGSLGGSAWRSSMETDVLADDPQTVLKTYREYHALRVAVNGLQPQELIAAE